MSNLPFTILSTKLLPESLIQSAWTGKLQVECIPFITTVPKTGAALKQTIEDLAQKNITAVFTSGIAAKAVAAMRTKSPEWDIFCIKGETSKNVTNCFPQSTIIATASYGADLADEIVKYKEIKEVVFFCGDRRLDVLPTKLLANGVAIEEFVVYDTLLNPIKIEKKYKAIMFYSPSGVESFFSLNEINEEVIVVSIGATTAAAIEKYCNNQIYTSQDALPSSMIDLLKEIKECN